jgi:hypothetical protein
MRYDYQKEMWNRAKVRMKIHLLNKYSYAGILLVGTSAVFILLPLFSSLGEFTSATFVLSGLACAMTGIFIFSFSQDEPFDPQFVRLLPVQGCMNLCRVMADLGVTGNAHFLPPRVTGEARVLQFNSTQPYTGSPVNATGSFIKTSPAGTVFTPSCNPLIQDLKMKNMITLPDTEENITQLLCEVLGTVYDLAQKVSVQWNGHSWEGNLISIRLHHYRLIEGCRVIAEESPGCCTKNPCPACSLCAVLIAEVTGKVVSLQECSMGPDSSDINAVFLILPLVNPPGKS